MKAGSAGWLRALPRGVVVGMATLGPVGHLPAPGTWGSLIALPWAALLWTTGLNPAAMWVLLAASLLLAVGVSSAAEVHLGQRDPGKVILDEFTAMPLCFLGWDRLAVGNPPWVLLLAGFAVFRFFDIAKPLGIRRLQELPGGWGVVVDDVAAALAACAVLHAGRMALDYFAS